MRNLIYKELRLTAHPTLFLFSLMGALVLVPAYPYGMVFFFGCLSVFFTFMNARENRDAFFTASLPVAKHDVVKAKCLIVCLAQVTQLLLTIPFAFLRLSFLADGNPAGIEANVAYFGFGLITYALFDFFFLTAFYKTAYKVGTAFFAGLIPVFLSIFFMEACVHIPALTWLDSTEPGTQLRQLPILAAGVVLYAVGMLSTYRLAARRFARVDL